MEFRVPRNSGEGKTEGVSGGGRQRKTLGVLPGTPATVQAQR